MLRIRRKSGRARGFAMLEVLVAISILAIGLLGVAALLAQLSGTTTHSRYTGTEVTLASEKLEDLNKVTRGVLVAGGSLTADVTNGGANYFDDVQISSQSGGVVDTLSGQDTQAIGPATTDNLTFHRRWLIEADVPVAGVDRLTVIVFPKTGTASDEAQSFQATLVRP